MTYTFTVSMLFIFAAVCVLWAAWRLLSAFVNLRKDTDDDMAQAFGDWPSSADLAAFPQNEPSLAEQLRAEFLRRCGQ